MGTSELIKSINTITANGTSSIGEDDRKQLLQACEGLIKSLESPFESMAKILFPGWQAIMLRLGIDMKLFDAVTKRSKETESGEVSIEQLAEDCNADPLLVTRLMRFLSTMSIFNQTSATTFTLTPLAASYVSESPLSAVVIQYTQTFFCVAHLPSYFSHHGWTSPTDAYSGPFQFAAKTKEHYFDWVAHEPYYQDAFNKSMTILHNRRGVPWYDFFPVTERLTASSPNEVLLIDVGGGHGSNLLGFRQAFPQVQGRLVLQELAVVLETLDKSSVPGIEAVAQDFFNPQPAELKNAKAYFLRSILHDWPDKQALQILSHIKEAMGPDSLLLINETVMPEVGAGLGQVIADVGMMVGFSSLERTRVQWEALLDAGGFELVRVWAPESAGRDGLGMAGTSIGQQVLLEARVKRE